MSDVATARAAFAESIRASAGLTSPRVVDALAQVPRERFLGPGPWSIFGEFGPRLSESGDPVHVYANTSIAIDPARALYNGQPALIAGWLEALALRPGARVVHIGCATGYYSALIAHAVGERGSVQAIEVDPELAVRAREALSPWPWVRVAEGDGATGLDADVDAVLVHAGATHVLPSWLAAVRDGGRLLVPLTVSMAGMAASLGKGVVLKATRETGAWSARLDSVVMIYSLVGLRDDALNQTLGAALMARTWDRVAALRTEPHEADASCWLHVDGACLSSGGRA